MEPPRGVGVVAVDGNDLVLLSEEAANNCGPNEPRGTCNEHPHEQQARRQLPQSKTALDKIGVLSKILATGQAVCYMKPVPDLPRPIRLVTAICRAETEHETLLYEDIVDFGNGTLGKHHRVVLNLGRHGALALPMLDYQILLVQQYRYAVGRTLWEIPGGAINPDDETPEEAVKREILEETGYTVSALHELGRIHPEPSILAAHDYLYLAQLSSRPTRDPEPGIVLKTFTVADVRARIASGEFTDGYLLAAFARADCKGMLP